MSQQGISYSSAETQRELRIEKMNKFIATGHDPFSPNSKRDYTLAEVKENFESLKPNKSITLAGRIKSKRVSGKIAFGTMEDESLPSGFQFIFKQDHLPADDDIKKRLSFNQFKDLFDEGDYLQATGYLDESQRGEPSLFVQEYQILTKALRGLPEILEYENFETRYLDRVADFKMNTKDTKGLSVRKMIELKSKYWQIWREEMIQQKFLEVETPTLESIPGGGEAKTFTTFYNELEQSVHLRIAPELNLKRMIAGGFEKVFEIGKNFRNEGSSPQHLQEYTAIEWYAAYMEYNEGMKITKTISQRLVKEILGDYIQTDYYGNTINWGEWCTPQEAAKNNWELLDGWPKIKYYDAVRYFSNNQIDTENKTDKELVEIAKNLGINEATVSLGTATLLDKIWKKARVNTTNPFFLILPPVELEPLAKRHQSDTRLTERFQLVAGSAELGKGFTELNDPIDQYDRFKEQQKARDAGNEEAQFMNEDYVKALEYGTPPMAGFGTSERMFSFLLSKHIKECVTFPAVRNQENTFKKSKKTMEAHIVLFNPAELSMNTRLNVVAHLSASFAARKGKSLINLENSTTIDGEKIPMNIQHTILMKQTDDSSKLSELKKRAEENGLLFTVFTQDMLNNKDEEIIQDKQENKTSGEINYLGVLVYGKKGDCEEVTENFSMLN